MRKQSDSLSTPAGAPVASRPFDIEGVPIPNYQRVLIGYDASGRLDEGFGDAGLRVIDNGSVVPDGAFSDQGGIARERGLLVDTDGRIVTLLSDRPPTSERTGDVLLARHTSEGHIDTSFGDQGIVRLSPLFAQLGRLRYISAMSVDRHGRILLGLCHRQDNDRHMPGLARFSEDGSLDTGFREGMVAVAGDRNGHSYVTALATYEDEIYCSLSRMAADEENYPLYEGWPAYTILGLDDTGQELRHWADDGGPEYRIRVPDYARQWMLGAAANLLVLDASEAPHTHRALADRFHHRVGETIGGGQFSRDRVPPRRISETWVVARAQPRLLAVGTRLHVPVGEVFRHTAMYVHRFSENGIGDSALLSGSISGDGPGTVYRHATPGDLGPSFASAAGAAVDSKSRLVLYGPIYRLNDQPPGTLELYPNVVQRFLLPDLVPDSTLQSPREPGVPVGIAVVDTAWSIDWCLASDDAVVVLGKSDPGGVETPALLRVDEDGSLDTSFGSADPIPVLQAGWEHPGTDWFVARRPGGFVVAVDADVEKLAFG